MKYATSYGYKVEVEIIRDAETDSAVIIVYAPMYINKQWTFPQSYTASQFSDGEILTNRHFQTVMLQHYPTI